MDSSDYATISTDRPDASTTSISYHDYKQECESFEFIPANFQGIATSTFGSSRKDNPFLELKATAMDIKIAKEERMQAVKYMCRIPHVHMRLHAIEAAISIISDDSYPIGERYYFFSNNEKFQKLDGHVHQACHHFYFYLSKDKKQYPLMFRILSAQYIYLYSTKNAKYTLPDSLISRNEDTSTESEIRDIWQDARVFIISLAIDPEETVRIRSEAADILYRKIDRTDAIIGKKVIDELGDLYLQNRLRTIYTNAQNAHNETITESVMSVIRTLMRTVTTTRSTDEIFNRVVEIVKHDNIKRETITNVLRHIIMYPAKYEGITLTDILLLVWEKICTQEASIRSQLELRLIEEFCEMDMTCGGGHVTRLINILSGYIAEEGLQMKMSINDQLRSNIFGRLQANLKFLPIQNQDDILAEISDDKSKKATAKEFVLSYSVYDELKSEFVDAEFISAEEFEPFYTKCINEFLGIVLAEPAVNQS